MGDYDDEAWKEEAVREEAWIDDLWRDYLRGEPDRFWRGREEADSSWLERMFKKLARKIVEWFKYSLMIALMLALALSAAPAVAALGASSGEYQFSYRLLGLSKDLYGVHAEPGWMLIVGEGGLIAEARRVGSAWIYEPVTIGGKDLTDVIWSGDVGLAIGAGRAIMLQRIGGAVTARDLPFLVDSFIIAAWSPKRDFAIILSSSSLYYYEPGWAAAKVLSTGMRPLIALKPYNVAGEECAVAVVSRDVQSSGGRRSELLLVRVHKGGIMELEPLSAGGDLKSALENLAASTAHAPSIAPIVRFVRWALEYSIKIEELALIVGVYGAYNGSDFYAMIARGRASNLVLINVNDQVKVYSLAFLTFNIYPYEDGGLRFVVVGAGGGVVVIDPLLDSVMYCSVPSAYKIIFLDSETAVITSPYGLFIYNYTSVEYFPMPIPPTHVHISHEGSSIYVSDGAGNIYELVRPAPWAGGLTLRYYIEGGYALDMESTELGEVVLVRGGRLAGREGVGFEEYLKQLTGLLERTGREGAVEAMLGARSALFMMGAGGLVRLKFEEAPSGFDEYSIVDVARVKGGLVLVGRSERNPFPPLLVEGLRKVIPLSAPAGSYYKVAVHPSGALALIAGESAVLLYDLRQEVIEPLPVPAARYEAVEFSSDGSYALIGGAGTLLLYDGAINEVAQKFVVRYLYLAAKPGDGARFLASTSLGLMELKMVAHPNPGTKIHSGPPRAEVVESGAVRLIYPLRASGTVKIVGVAVNCLPQCAVQDAPTLELKPLELTPLYITLLFEESERSYVNGTAHVTLIAESGEKYDLPPARFTIYFEKGFNALDAIGTALPILILIIAVLFVVTRLKSRRPRERSVSPRRGEEARREEAREEDRYAEEVREVIWD